MATSSELQAAIALHQAGNVDAAIQAYKKILNTQPNNATVQALLGAAYLQNRQYVDAKEALLRATTLKSEEPDTFYNLGLCLQELGEQEPALEAYRTAIALQPKYASAYGNRGNLYRDMGRYQEALADYSEALRYKPQYPLVYFNRALLHEKNNNVAQAINDYVSALQQNPDYWDAQCNLANLFKNQQNLEQARSLYRGILAKQPTHFGALVNLGRLELEQAHYEAAKELFEAAYQIDQTAENVQSGLIETDIELKNYTQALARLDALIAKNPKKAQYFQQKGIIALQQHDLQAARVNLEQAVTLAPKDATIWMTFGYVLKQANQLDKALECYQKSLAIDPDSADCQFNLGVLLLLQGNYPLGFSYYEKRWMRKNPKPYTPKPPEYSAPLWLGKTSLNRKRIFISSEQGLGDTIQCLRFMPDLKKLGATVIVEAPKALLRLIAAVEGVDEVIAKNTPPPNFDYYCPIMSLPFAFGITLEKLPGTLPYLKVPKPIQTKWRKRLQKINGFKLGIAWRGNAKHWLLGERSLPLEKLLAQLPRDMQVIPLQQTLTSEEQKLLSDKTHCHVFCHDLTDLADTAAVCQQLDLIISIDTCIAHLAGALGLPAWILLPEAPDWRWLLQRSDSPWYPTLTLFRQSQPFDWHSALQALGAALQNLTGNLTPTMDRLNTLFNAGHYWQAMAYAQPYAARNPNHAGMQNIMGALAVQLDQMTEGEAYLQRAVKLDPTRAIYFYNLGLAQDNLLKSEEAVASYKKALELNPNDAKIYSNLGKSEVDLEQYSLGLQHYAKALQLNPNYSLAKMNKGFVLLVHGNYEEGLPLYEYRLQRTNYTAKDPKPKEYPQPRWNGDQPLQGKKILITHEQGYGDAIMFSRYIPLVAAQGAQIYLEAHEALKPLFKKFPGIAGFNIYSQVDYHCPIGSLPLAFHTTLETIPAAIPYLSADPDKVFQWENRLKPKHKPRVGLVWQGNKLHSKDLFRSIKLRTLLSALPSSVDYIALQKELDHDDIDVLKKQQIPFFGEELIDFGDTAALVALMDLVITVDTSVAHLAGALGKPTWILLTKAPDWRWLLERSDSPWYPTVRLFRQSKRKEWQDVIQAVADALRHRDFSKLEPASAPLLASPQDVDTKHGDNAHDELEQAMTFHRAGDLTKAKSAYLSILANTPQQDTALGMLGLLSLQEGDANQALDYLDKALQYAPTVSDYHYNRGIALTSVQRNNEAMQAYAEAIHHNPTNAAAHCNLANLQRDIGELWEAQEHYAAALSSKKNYVLVYFNRALLYEKLNQPERAMDDYQQAIKIDPTLVGAAINLANLYFKQGNADQARHLLNQILHQDPNNQAALTNLGQWHIDQKQFTQAHELFQQAVRIDPSFINAQRGLVNALIGLEDYAAALEITQRLVRQQPKMALAYYTRSQVYLALHKFDSAVSDLEMCLKLQPNNVSAWEQLGVAWKKIGELAKALFYLRKAMHMQSALETTQLYLAETLLLSGDYLEGFALYRSHNAVTPQQTDKHQILAFPVWTGKQVKQPDTLYITADPDPCETLLLLRYVNVLQKRGVSLYVESTIPYLNLLPHGAEGIRLVPPASPPNTSLCCPLYGLPRALQTSPSTIPQSIPYLEVPAADKTKWQNELGLRQGLRVGLTWKIDKASTDSHRRDTPELTALLAALPATVTIVCLETTVTEAERDTLQNDPRVWLPSKAPGNEVDLAALGQAVDLIVGIDNELVHMAGGLGLAAWVLVEHDPRWYWGTEATTTPWYPTLTLYRQSTTKNWEQTLNALTQGFAALASPSENQLRSILVDVEQKRLTAAWSKLAPYLAMPSEQAELNYVAGIYFNARHEFEIAGKYLRRATQLNRHKANYVYKQGCNYGDSNKVYAAIAAYRRCLRIEPNHLYALNNIGSELSKIRCYAEMIEQYDKVLRLSPNFTPVLFQKSLVYLTLGRYAEGWILYEYRKQFEGFFPVRLKENLVENRHEWTGVEPLNGKWILITYEQGFGDMCMFARYLPRLKAMGANIMLIAYISQVSLFKQLPCVDLVFSEHDTVADFDYYCAMGSLPLAFQTTVNTIPIDFPYLYSDITKRLAWQQKLGKKTLPRIGLFWKGRDNNPGNQLRNVPLPLLLKALPPGFAYYALQQMISKEDCQRLDQHQITYFTNELQDFSTTAALVEQMDLVLSVDSSIAHLAGGLGKPTWMMLAFSPDWRWYNFNDYCAWYPFMRLFRQNRFNDWSNVLASVQEALISHFKQPSTH